MIRTADLLLGTKIRRLRPSTTARDIMPNDIGVVGGLNPQAHAQPTNNFSFGFSYFPVQWMRTGLWSSLEPEDEDNIWEYVNKPIESDDAD